MKKILLATTVLVGTAGFAAAEVTLSGSAAAGLAKTAAGADFAIYNGVSLDFGATVETDSGLTLGVSTGLSAGEEGVDLNDVDFDDVAVGGADSTEGLDNPTVTIAGAFGKLSISNDNVDHYYDDGVAGDVGYEYTAGDLSLGLVLDVDGIAAVDAGETQADYSAKVGYTFSGVDASLAIDSNDSYDLNLGYAVNGLSAGLELDHDGVADSSVTTLSLGYEANGLSAGIDLSDDDTWELSAGYSANGLTVGASVDDADAWELTTAYDLGAGATVGAGLNSDSVAYAGVAFSF